MKFVYEYRTKSNELKRGEISAPDRDAAYAALKSEGIRPSKVSEAPGFLNKLFGKGKRWLAIAILALAVAVGVVTHWGAIFSVKPDSELRAHLYGDPAVLQKISDDFWRTSFPDVGDAFLARNGQPGVADSFVYDEAATNAVKSALKEGARAHVKVDDADPAELAKMKRIVNGMKDELAAYLAAGGDVGDYMKLCGERIRTEVGIATGIRDELARMRKKMREGVLGDIPAEWDKKNRVLRSFGLETIPFPEE